MQKLTPNSPRPPRNNMEATDRPNTDNAPYDEALLELAYCASRHEDNARLVGNIRAVDIYRAIIFVMTQRSTPPTEQGE